AGGDHHRPAPQRAALRLAAEHHEGQEEADRSAGARRARRRRDAAPQDPEGRGAAQAQGRHQGEDRRRTGRQTEERSGSDLSMAILVIAGHDGKTVRANVANAVAAAGQMGSDVAVLVAGSNCGDAAKAAAAIAGVAKVIQVEDAAYANWLAEDIAPLV